MKKDAHSESIKRLLDIEKAVTRIELYVKNENERSFCKSNVVHDAVLFQFSVIGEAVKHIESEILEKYAYPWYKVRSFRNLIAHEYFNVHLPAVWQIIKKDLPVLKKTIEGMIKEESRS